MKRTTLSPRDAAWLANTMQARRKQFGGWFMEADPPPADPPSDPAPTDPPADPKADEPLGEGGKKALKAERDRASAAEKAAADMRTELDQFKQTLASALGVKTDDGKTDVLASVQQQLAQMQRDNVVLALANEHSITDKSDIELLRNSSLEGEALTAMAARLKPAAPTGTPQPDLSQGPNGKPPADPGNGVSRLRHAYANPTN